MSRTLRCDPPRARYGQTLPEHRRESRSRDRVMERLGRLRGTRPTVLRVQVARAEQLLLDLADACALEGLTFRLTRFLCQLDARRLPLRDQDPIELHQDHSAADALENTAREDALLLQTPEARQRHLKSLWAEIDAKTRYARYVEAKVDRTVAS